ncbi:MAG TPA: TetR/AcrR family transcriptional regulator [Sphingorhabdus sp.]|nr:TetR/AcrR family transcriptional regulator [Sphingorhabdus sp.]
MPVTSGISATMTPAAKTPRTERGRKTLRLLLDAAAAEFGEKGFHESSVVSITQRAGVALGSFYTYFDSKDSLFRALVQDMSRQVGMVGANAVRDIEGALAGEHAVLQAFITFARDHNELYRIIDEAEFVDPESYHAHYEGAAARIQARLEAGAANGQLRADVGAVHAWALMGMNVFLGLRYGVWTQDRDPAEIADIVADMLTNGLKR